MRTRRTKAGPSREHAWRRGFAAVLLLGIVLVTSGCQMMIGCRVVSLGEPGTPSLLYVDDSACETPPTPVVPEVPLPIVLPVAAAVVVAVVARRQVSRRGREVGSN